MTTQAAELADMLAKRAALLEEEGQRPGIPPVRVASPGVFPDLTPRDYHADPAPEPSLSAGVASCLLFKTPFHGWMKQPRLTAEWREEGEEAADADSNGPLRFGSIAHELLLGRGSGIVVITETQDAKGNVIKNPTSYAHRETQRLRDEAIAEGSTPCLRHELERAETVVEQVRSGLRQIPQCEDAFGPEALGAEVVAVAHERELGVYTRILVDSWGPENWQLWDLKTTRDLSDEALSRKIANDRLGMRVAFYERCLARVMPALAGKMRMRLVFVETMPPHMVRVVDLPRASVDRGHEQVAAALGIWKRCIQSNRWPGYRRQIEMIGDPIFAAKQWDERVNPDSLVFDPEIYELVANDPFRLAAPFPLAPRDTKMLTEITG